MSDPLMISKWKNLQSIICSTVTTTFYQKKRIFTIEMLQHENLEV